MARQERGISQRGLALLAGLSYKTVQLLESEGHDPKISSLNQVAKALGYPVKEASRTVETIFETPPDAICMISEKIMEERESSWKLWLFNFVDAFRRDKAFRYVESPPIPRLSPKIQALLASSVETLCAELALDAPSWCAGIPMLQKPWFVSEVENLKAAALLESPVHFRKRNIFVLSNFLERK